VASCAKQANWCDFEWGRHVMTSVPSYDFRVIQMDRPPLLLITDGYPFSQRDNLDPDARQRIGNVSIGPSDFWHEDRVTINFRMK
jgi:hypothetical protein